MAKILIVDDNADIRFALQQICEFKGWHSVVAPDVTTAVSAYVSGGIDLILMDYHMPVLSGLEGVKRIRQRSSTVPIIILTVDEKQEVADAFMEAGASDFALKPVKAPDLVSRIAVHLRFAAMKGPGNGPLIQEGDGKDQPQEDQGYKAYRKGISKGTLAIIETFFRNNTEAYTIDDISSETGLAYQTVHRYLKHLIEFKVVQTEYRYGKVGRPKQYFWWV